MENQIEIEKALHGIKLLIDENKHSDAIRELNVIAENALIQVSPVTQKQINDKLLVIKTELEAWNNKKQKPANATRVFTQGIKKQLTELITMYKDLSIQAVIPIPTVQTNNVSNEAAHSNMQTANITEDSKFSFWGVEYITKQVIKLRATHKTLYRILKAIESLKIVFLIGGMIYSYHVYFSPHLKNRQSSINNTTDTTSATLSDAKKFDTTKVIGTGLELYDKKNNTKIAYIGTNNILNSVPHLSLYDTLGLNMGYIGASSTSNDKQSNDKLSTFCIGLVYRTQKNHLVGTVIHRTGENYEQTRVPYDPTVVGVVSNIVMDQKEATYVVALSGIVKVRVTANSKTGGGAISPGDLLVSSEVEGVAMKPCPKDCSTQGRVIGKALDYYNKTAEGEILMLVMAR